MQVFKSIQEALKDNNYNYFVISNNEVHACKDEQEAECDKAHADRLEIDTELTDRKTAEIKYL